MFAMDTNLTISVWSEQNQSQTIQDAFELVKDIEKKYSSWLPDSLVSKLNQTKRQEFEPDFIEMMKIVLEFSEESNGLFDVTIAPISKLWKAAMENEELPDENQIQELLKLVGYRNIEISGNIIELKNGSTIELGAVLKGYVTDKLKDFLISRNVSKAIINFGGNIYLLGEKGPNERWNVGIQDPFSSRNDYSISLESKGNTSVISSGDYERFFIKDDILYHHIINPKTGYPVQSGNKGVTIINPSGIKSDILSTFIFSLELNDAILLSKKNNYDIIIIDKNKNVYISENIKNYNIQDNLSFKLLDTN